MVGRTVSLLSILLVVAAAGCSSPQEKTDHVVTKDREESYARVDKEQIRKAIQGMMPEYSKCYNSALAKKANLNGKVVLSWAIDDGGRVKTAKVAKSNMGSPDLENCMLDRLRATKFPMPPAGQEAEVTYPFVFTHN